MAFRDKNEFEAGDREDEFRTEAFPLESADMESPDDDEEEEAELSEEELAEEMKPFTVAEWKQEFPDYTAEELVEKIPKSPRASRMALVASCLMGTLLGAAIAGVLVNNQPGSQEARAFFIFFLVLAPLFSFIWHWLFYLRGERVGQKMKEQEQEQEANPATSEPIHPK
ncbi:MAG TPA: hypothetical protein VFQ41_24190 [Candidatus Angelobacter sp.]|nr:hypothetical protein [Candidatus Angelobacter sp.]